MNYYNNKSQNKIKALEHVELLENNYKNIIEDQVNKSIVYDKDFKEEIPKVANTPSIEVIDKLTLEPLDDIDHNEKVGVLNFASYKNAGGKFLDGSYAQEEYLCHYTTLYNIISNTKFNGYYDYNRQNLNKGMYLNRAIFSPEVTVFDKERSIAVLTCASPNRSYMLRSNKVTEEQNYVILYSRIKFVLDIFEYNKIDTLILGAFGCGVFRQDPNDVAQIFKQLLPRYNFKKVIFAIPNEHSTNHKVFKEILSK